MSYKIVRWYDERKTVTHLYSFEEAYKEYSKKNTCNTIQVYFLRASETPILLAQREC